MAIIKLNEKVNKHALPFDLKTFISDICIVYHSKFSINQAIRHSLIDMNYKTEIYRLIVSYKSV